MLRPRMMKAAILTGLHQPLVIDAVLLPGELDWGQVLVKVFTAGFVVLNSAKSKG